MISISLPAAIKKWVEKQATEKGYPSTDEFFLEMLRREQALEVRERIDDILTAAMSAGEPSPMTSTDWRRIRNNGRRMAKARRHK